MKTQKYLDLVNELTEKICSNNHTWVDVALLLVYLRQLISKDTLLYDLTNFVPHGDSRNKGDSHTYIESYISNLIKVAEGKGPIFFADSAPRPIFSEQIIISELLKALGNLGISVNEKSFTVNKDWIISSILKIVDQTKFDKFKDGRITDCRLEKTEDGRVMFFFRLQGLKDGAIKGISSKMQFSIPFLK